MTVPAAGITPDEAARIAADREQRIAQIDEEVARLTAERDRLTLDLQLAYPLTRA